MEEIIFNIHQSQQANEIAPVAQPPTGYVGGHKVRIGNNPPINLRDIGTSHIPFQGFKKATRVTSELAGMTATTKDLIAVLQTTDGHLDVRRLLRKLNTLDTYSTMYAATSGKAFMDISNVASERMAPAVQAMTNQELTSAYGTLCGGDVAQLKELLEYVARKEPDMTQTCSMALSNLMDLEALIVSEASRRFCQSQVQAMDEVGQHHATLTETHRAADDLGPADGVQVEQRGVRDMSAVSMAVALETVTDSANRRVGVETQYGRKMSARMENVPELKKIGDYLRGQELTINIRPEVFFGNDGNDCILTDLRQFPVNAQGFQLKNMFALKAEGKNVGQMYSATREEAENSQFPLLRGNVRPEQRPIYGALNMGGQLGGTCPTYGGMVLVMKPHVKQRATYTYGDTMDIPVIRFTADREAAFIDQLKGQGQLIGMEKVAELDKADSSLRKVIHELFSSNESLALGFVATGELTQKLRDELRLNRNQYNFDPLNMEKRYVLEACMMRSCVDIGKTSAQSASYENIENLMSQMENADQLRMAMNVSHTGSQKMVLDYAPYIEAQIHQPLVLERDVAEIRLQPDALPEDPDEQKRALRALKEWSKRSGVKVTVINNSKAGEISMEMSEHQRELNEAVAQKMRPEINQQVENCFHRFLDNGDAVMDFLESLPDKDQLQVFLGDTPLLSGTNKPVVLKKILEAMNDKFAGTYIFQEKKAQEAFTEALHKQLQVKVDLLREMEAHPDVYLFETVDQKQAFAKWVVESMALKTVEEMKMLYQSANLMSGLFKEIAEGRVANADLPKRLMDLAMDLDGKIMEYRRTLPPKQEFGPDDSFTEVNRSVFLGVAMLKNSGWVPPNALPAVYNAMCSPEVRQYLELIKAQFDLAIYEKDEDDLSEEAKAHVERAKAAPGWQADNDRIVLMNTFELALNNTLSLEVHQPKWKVRKRPLEQFGGSLRAELGQRLPVIKDLADNLHPCRLRTLGTMARPLAGVPLPTTLAGRRQFLLRCLPRYREHERDFDRGRDWHSRSHATRVFVWANVLGNILKERGVDIDVNATAMMAAGHDIGRRDNGDDIYEARSAALTQEMIQADGVQPGAQYLEGISHGIASKEQNARTIEAYVLHSADSLDYSRVGPIDLRYFPFLRENILVGDNVLGLDEDLRKQLVKEAELLTCFSHPLYVLRKDADRLLADGDGDEAAEKRYLEIIGQGTEIIMHRTESMSDEDMVNEVELAIRNNPQLFPLLNRYYHD